MIDREFRIGDRVTCNIYGLGIVTEIHETMLVVKLDKGSCRQYYLDGTTTYPSKRSLFILPKVKPTKQQIKEKYKQLLDEVGEVEFVEGEYNYCLIAYFENGKYYFNLSYNIDENGFNEKYITKENAEKIIEQMHEFIKGEL